MIVNLRAISTAALSPEGPYYDPGLRTWLDGNFWDGRVSDLAKRGPEARQAEELPNPSPVL